MLFSRFVPFLVSLSLILIGHVHFIDAATEMPQRIRLSLRPKGGFFPEYNVQYSRNGQRYYQNTFSIQSTGTVFDAASITFDYPLLNITGTFILDTPEFSETALTGYNPMQLYHLTPTDQYQLNTNQYRPGLPILRIILAKLSTCFESGVLVFNNGLMNNLVPYVKESC